LAVAEPVYAEVRLSGASMEKHFRDRAQFSISTGPKCVCCFTIGGVNIEVLEWVLLGLTKEEKERIFISTLGYRHGIPCSAGLTGTINYDGSEDPQEVTAMFNIRYRGVAL
jgi:hypothetical protein